MLLFSESPVETHNICPECHKRTVELAYQGPRHQVSDTERMVRRAHDLGPLAPPVAHQLYDEVQRWTYKPGWKLAITYTNTDPFMDGTNTDPFMDGLTRLRIEFKALDSRGSGAMIPIVGHYAVPMLYHGLGSRFSEEELTWFRHWLVDTLMEAEQHELREWLRRDGELHDDPHRTDR